MLEEFQISDFMGAMWALLAVLVLMPLAIKLAVKIGFVDQPGGRKHHENPVPPIGGLVLFPVFMLVSFLNGVDLEAIWPLYAALSLILIVGALDDYNHVNAWVKFGAQFLAAGLIVLPGHAQLMHLGPLFGEDHFWLGFMAIPFSIISVVLFINALNLLDGLDGLASGQGFITLLWLAVGCFVAGVSYPFLMFAPLMGALLGFLFYNLRTPWRKSASVFLGDAGSMGLGLVLAWFCIHLAQDGGPIQPISVAWLIALPIFDVCAQFYRRAREGRHPFSPDRGHFHHHFIEAGFSVGQATARILLITFILGGIGYIGIQLGVSQVILTISWIGLLLTHMAVSQKPERYTNLVRHLGH